MPHAMISKQCHYRTPGIKYDPKYAPIEQAPYSDYRTVNRNRVTLKDGAYKEEAVYQRDNGTGKPDELTVEVYYDKDGNFLRGITSVKGGAGNEYLLDHDHPINDPDDIKCLIEEMEGYKNKFETLESRIFGNGKLVESRIVK